MGGGAIHVRGALIVTNSMFTDNLTNSYGGGINLENTNGNVDSNKVDCEFTGNGSDAGGGLYAGTFGSVVRVTNSRFKLNTSTILNSKGGGIFLSTGALVVTDSTLTRVAGDKCNAVAAEPRQVIAGTINNGRGHFLGSE